MKLLKKIVKYIIITFIIVAIMFYTLLFILLHQSDEKRQFEVNNDYKRIKIYDVMDNLMNYKNDDEKYEFIDFSLHHGCRLSIENGKYFISGNNSLANPLTEIYFQIAINEENPEVYILDKELKLERKYYSNNFSESEEKPLMDEQEVIDTLYELIKDL